MQALRAVRRGRLRQGLTFGALFHNRGARWCHFLLIFRSLEALWERWWHTFLGVALAPAIQTMPQSIRTLAPRHPQNSVPFWDPFGSHFVNYFAIGWALFLSIVF